MNWDQATGIIRILLAAGGPVAVLWTHLGLSVDQANAFDNALLALLSAAAPLALAVWSYVANKRKAKATSVGQTTGAMVVIDPKIAPPDLVAAALDPNNKGVVTTQQAAAKLATKASI